MTIVRIIDDSDGQELACLEGDFRIKDVEKAAQQVKDKHEADRTLNDLIEHLKGEGYTFKPRSVWEVHF